MKVLTFGEIMLRLKAPGHERLMQSPMLEATFGGGILSKLRYGCCVPYYIATEYIGGCLRWGA